MDYARHQATEHSPIHMTFLINLSFPLNTSSLMVIEALAAHFARHRLAVRRILARAWQETYYAWVELHIPAETFADASIVELVKKCPKFIDDGRPDKEIAVKLLNQQWAMMNYGK